MLLTVENMDIWFVFDHTKLNERRVTKIKNLEAQKSYAQSM